MAFTDADGRFTFSPVGLNPGAVTVGLRAMQWSDEQADFIPGAWSTFSFVFQPPANAPAVVASLSLAVDTGDADGVTSNPTLEGTVQNEGGLAGGGIEFEQ